MARRKQPRKPGQGSADTPSNEVLFELQIPEDISDPYETIAGALKKAGMEIPPRDVATTSAPELPRTLELKFELDTDQLSSDELSELRDHVFSSRSHTPILKGVLGQAPGANWDNWPEYVWGQWRDYSGGETFTKIFKIRPRRKTTRLRVDGLEGLYSAAEVLPTRPVGDGKCQLIRVRSGRRWFPKCAGDCDAGRCDTTFRGNRGKTPGIQVEAACRISWGSGAMCGAPGASRRQPR